MKIRIMEDRSWLATSVNPPVFAVATNEQELRILIDRAVSWLKEHLDERP